MSKAEVTFTIEELVKELALRLMDERGLTMKQALDTVYNSETYSKVLDERTGLFSQSTVYVYSILESEILTGKPHSPTDAKPLINKINYGNNSIFLFELCSIHRRS